MTNSPRKKNPDYCIFQLLWCKYSHQGQFQATNRRLLSRALRGDAHRLAGAGGGSSSRPPPPSGSGGTTVNHSPKLDIREPSQPPPISYRILSSVSWMISLSPPLCSCSLGHPSSALWTSIGALSWPPAPGLHPSMSLPGRSFGKSNMIMVFSFLKLFPTILRVEFHAH